MRTRRLDQGAVAVEYALLVGLIALAVISGVTALGLAVIDLFTSVEFP
ncbi:MAG: Flp family type IVb pilin [Micromonosporaceae bacterium]|nr:Flp family type IVb pilin [Micromonosporaceae bacterium]